MENFFGIIYLIRNKLNNKCYIGQTIRELTVRFDEHVRDGRSPIQLAIKKYGIEHFELTVIDKANSIEDLNEKEIHWIATHKTLKPSGYNLEHGGNNHKTCDETKLKQSIAKQGNVTWLTGRTFSEETKLKISLAHKGKVLTEEHKLAIGIGSKGKTRSAETRAKMSLAKKGVKRPDLAERNRLRHLIF